MSDSQFDLILIDDDELIRATWKMCANVKGHKLACFENENQFLDSSIERNIPIYIDYHLTGSRNGFEIAQQLYANGYQKIFIATGSNLNETPDGILKIVGKDYPL